MTADKGHETRSLLLDAAARVFTRLGYARTTIAGITAEAAVSRPTFYACFQTKSDVFREVAARVRGEFLAAHAIQRRPTRRVARYVARLAGEGKADPAAAPDMVAEAIAGIFARFARRVTADRQGFESLVDELTAMYLRLIGVNGRPSAWIAAGQSAQRRARGEQAVTAHPALG